MPMVSSSGAASPRRPTTPYDALTGTNRPVEFTAGESADRHCEPVARSLVEQRVFDWLDKTLSRSP
jgi:hypothetical protein